MRKRTSFTTRAIVALLGLAVIAGGVLAVAPWTVSSDALREAVSRQLEEELGIELATAGRTTIAFLPTPRVKFEDVTLNGGDGAVLADGGALRGQLAWGALLYGRTRVTDASLAQTRIAVQIGADGRSPWDAPMARLLARLAADYDPRALAVESFGLVDATLVYTDAVTGRREVVRDADLTLLWETPTAPVSLIGSARLRGEVIQISLSGLSPAALARGTRSPIDLRLSGRLGRLGVTGTVATGRDSPWLTGRVSLETRATRDVLVWTGAQLPLGPSIGRLSLEGDASGVGRSLSLSGLRMTLGADRLDGALALRLNEGRVAISGTLAADALDLTRFASPVVDASDPSAPQRHAPLTLSRHTAADLDLRLSATSAGIGRVRLSELAMSLLVAEGRIDASVSRAGLAGGELRGRFSLADVANGIEMRLDAEGTDIDLAVLGRDLGAGWVAGRASGDVAVTGRGATADALAASMGGLAGVTVGPGEFIGVDLAEALRRFERQPLSATQTLRSGRTPFQSAGARLLVEQGVAQILTASFDSAQLSGMLEGVVSLRDGAIDAKAAVESTTPVGESNLISALTFAFRGPLTAVQLVPDAKALIQRSGAARLLLGAPVVAPATIEGEPPAQVEPAAQQQ